MDISDSQCSKSQSHVVHQTSGSASQLKYCRYGVSSTYILLPLTSYHVAFVAKINIEQRLLAFVCAVVNKGGFFILAAYGRIKAAVACGCTRSQALVPCESDQSVGPAGPSLSLTQNKV